VNNPSHFSLGPDQIITAQTKTFLLLPKQSFQMHFVLVYNNKFRLGRFKYWVFRFISICSSGNQTSSKNSNPLQLNTILRLAILSH